jgi:hypothetical protein
MNNVVMAEILRRYGAGITLRLKIEATASSGFQPDSASVIRVQARSLKSRGEETGRIWRRLKDRGLSTRWR